MKRVITITMDIDESTHEAKVTSRITEDGKVKKEWTPPQAVTVSRVLIHIADDLMLDLNKYMLKALDEQKEEQ